MPGRDSHQGNSLASIVMLLLSMQEQQGRAMRIQESIHIFICQAQSPPTMRSGREQGGCCGSETRHRAYISVRCLSATGCSMTWPVQRWHTRRRRLMCDMSCRWINAASCWPMQMTAESYVMFTHTLSPFLWSILEVCKRCGLAAMQSLDCRYGTHFTLSNTLCRNVKM